jgi:hypothetical protein
MGLKPTKWAAARETGSPRAHIDQQEPTSAPHWPITWARGLLWLLKRVWSAPEPHEVPTSPRSGVPKRVPAGSMDHVGCRGA